MTAPIARLLLPLMLAASAAASAETLVAAIPPEREPEPSERVVPGKGVFLVAKPSMGDPRFRQTVVLLLAHGEGGTLGLIINRPTELRLSRLLPDLQAPGADRHALYFGGPVGLNMLIYLVRSAGAPQGAQHVMGDVYYGADREVLEALLAQRKDERELRLFIGHSGWAAGQLAGEIARGDWLLLEADARTVFDKDLQTIWPELMQRRPPPRMMIEAPILSQPLARSP